MTYGRTYDIGEFTESYADGWARKTITESARTMPVFWLHRHETIPIGKVTEWRSGDDLRAVVQMDTRPEAQEMTRLVREEYVNGVSVGYQSIKDEWRNGVKPHCNRLEGRLFELSLTAVPALDDAEVLVRSTAGVPEGLPPTHRPRLAEFAALLESIKNR
jgi:HK97 family phage prohead protease